MSDSKKTILIVDDEKFIRQSFADYFEDNLWRILQAKSGEQALEFFNIESPDCAIVDIRLGGMDGNVFIREAIKKKPNMVFIICTGSPEYHIPQDLQKLPCISKYIFRKPVNNLSEMEEELQRLLQNNKTTGV